MIFRFFFLLLTVAMFGCSNPSLSISRTTDSGAIADVTVAEFDRAPARTPPLALDKPPADAGVGLYDFTLEEVQFRESSFWTDGKQAQSVKIVARNRGDAPVSVTVTLLHDISVNVKRNSEQPRISVVPPHSEMVVARFDPIIIQGRGHLYAHSDWKIGDYTARHACPQGYRFPFAEGVSAYADVSAEEGNANPYLRNAVIFSMPADARVLAARKGIVVQISEKHDVDILHDDSTIATYSHLGELAREINVGKAVMAGDPIGLPGKIEEKAYLKLAVWRPETKTAGTLAKHDGPDLQAVSFPMEFCAEARHCSVLKQSQPVPFAAPSPPAAAETASATTAARGATGEFDFHLRDDHAAEPSSLHDGPASSTIVAVNHSYAPVSVIFNLSPGTENIRPDVHLPHSDVIPPQSEKVLARLFTIDAGKRARYSYHYLWQLGDLAARHQCPERYRFPFAAGVRATALIPDKEDSDSFTRYSVQFSLPVETKVLAARSGIVVRVKESGDLDILQNDSTIATYNHLGKVEKEICAGKLVSAGDVLGVAGRSGQPGKAYMQITVWSPERQSSDSLLKGANFQPVSFPLEFCADAQDCRVLTNHQPVLWGKSPKMRVTKKSRGN